MPTPPSAQLPFAAKWRVAVDGCSWINEVWASSISEEYNDGWFVCLWLGNVQVAQFPRGKIKAAWMLADEGNRVAIEAALGEMSRYKMLSEG